MIEEIVLATGDLVIKEKAYTGPGTIEADDAVERRPDRGEDREGEEDWDDEDWDDDDWDDDDEEGDAVEEGS